MIDTVEDVGQQSMCAMRKAKKYQNTKEGEGAKLHVIAWVTGAAATTMRVLTVAQ